MVELRLFFYHGQINIVKSAVGFSLRKKVNSVQLVDQMNTVKK